MNFRDEKNSIKATKTKKIPPEIAIFAITSKMMEGIELTDDNRHTTYEPLGSTARNFIDSSPEHNSHTNAPKDHRNLVYLALLTAGIGFVLPYNSFIIASDYWSERFPSRSVELDLSCTYIIVAFASVLLNNIFLSIAPFRVRILFGKHGFPGAADLS